MHTFFLRDLNAQIVSRMFFLSHLKTEQAHLCHGVPDCRFETLLNPHKRPRE